MKSALFWEFLRSADGSFLPTRRGKLSVYKGRGVQEGFLLDCSTLGEGTDRLTRNVGKKLPFCAASNPTRGQTSSSTTVYKYNF